MSIKRMRMLIGADDAVTRRGLAALAQDSNPEVELVEVDTADEILKCLQEDRYELALLRLSEQSVSRCLEHTKTCECRVVLVDPSGPIDMGLLVDAGVRGVIFSPVTLESLCLALSAACSDSLFVGPIDNALMLELATSRIEYDLLVPAQIMAQLTAREAEILQQVLRGYSNQEIAFSLYIACSTVKAHLRRIMRKLGVTDRIALIAKVLSRNEA